MKSLHSATRIRAKRAHVWNVMLPPDTYRLWTAEFAEGSYFEGSWAAGERIRFLSPGGNGLTSMIAENRAPEFFSIKHLGFIKDGVEDTESEEVRRWAPSFENYSFVDTGSETELRVDIDVTPAYEEYMTRTWPKALAKLKAMCEVS
jgi:hypothetical protein